MFLPVLILDGVASMVTGPNIWDMDELIGDLQESQHDVNDGTYDLDGVTLFETKEDALGEALRHAMVFSESEAEVTTLEVHDAQ